MLTELVEQGVLITCLRAPLTVTNPLDHVIDRLQAVGAGTVPAVSPVLDEVLVVQAQIRRHNQADIADAEQAGIRAATTSRMRELSPAGRTPLAVDLRLDCNVRLPEQVAREMEWAADALARLTRQPTGEASWRDFYIAFCERYGVGTLVPVTEVVDPDAGLGFPAGYPGSVLPTRTGGRSERDEKLLALAWTAMADGSREIVLDDETIDALTVGEPSAELRVPPHVELAARIHAGSPQALDRGDYLLNRDAGAVGRDLHIQIHHDHRRLGAIEALRSRSDSGRRGAAGPAVRSAGLPARREHLPGAGLPATPARTRRAPCRRRQNDHT